MMADLFTIGGWILNIFTFIGGYFLGKRREKQQNKREIILEYYPDLIANLRLSVHDSHEVFIEGMVGQFDRFFEVLIGMDTDGTLKIIESLDKPLYDDMQILLNEIIPSLNIVQEKRRGSWESIQKRWIDWLVESKNDLPEFTDEPRFLVSEVTILWELWREHIESAQNKIDEVCQRRIKQSFNNTPELRSLILTTFQKIAEDEWEPIKSEYELVNARLKELIEDKIIPRMETTLSDLGK